ncbi:MAG: NAD(P)-dependent oxidoreductase [Burkholderiales bacterium]|jgi:3-hydroxyisobutyrate dehydrogenase|nr:NAD(P)-dependent oxidoreductase [Burkholderiaceae bacterium]NBS82608.1 NAD(P)-dependent oxidoreductase [Betaproteobacteria bacterium]NBT97692.1 NAD(P)-dependent oxidoreductase [Betaproteobacteria bacterium]NDE32019.1 NAD(P)-dependent oxidoreductase [Betaproteobacteria bacterium]
MSVETPATDQSPQTPTASRPLEGQSGASKVLHRELPRVGWIGTGIMGQSMAGHLLKAGYPLHVHNRSKQKAQALIEAGAQWHDDPISLAAQCDIVCTMLGYPSDVESLYWGGMGLDTPNRASLLGAIPKGGLLIDFTTSSPALARRIALAADALGLSSLDAPVSGGDIGARQAKLSIMVGGEAAAFERAQPLLACMGQQIVLQGLAGFGQHAKMCNQIVIASTLMGVCEAIAYMNRSGLDPSLVMQSIGSGGAASFQLNTVGAKILRGDFEPGFFMEHFVKDMSIALAEAERMQLSLPGLTQAKALYDRLMAQGYGRRGTQALLRAYD